MNNLVKNGTINLSDKWTLSTDSFNGIVLTFSETRERVKKDGTKETYIFQEPRYFAKVDQALERYIELSQTTPTKTIEEVLEVCKNINKTLEEFKKYKNW